MSRKSELDRVLAAAAKLQEVLPDAVLVGGAAAALHAGHRVSLDDDHVLSDLTERFADVLEALEETDGWVTARVRQPVLILGRLDDVETGIRQLIRRRPLEVEETEVGDKRLRVPTLDEILRIKAWLILRRNATRDYLDFVALADRLGSGAAAVVAGMDEYYADQLGPTGARVATQLVKQLVEPEPYDLSEVDLKRYRRLAPRWQEWSNVVAAMRGIATDVLETLAKEGP